MCYFSQFDLELAKLKIHFKKYCFPKCFFKNEGSLETYDCSLLILGVGVNSFQHLEQRSLARAGVIRPVSTLAPHSLRTFLFSHQEA